MGRITLIYLFDDLFLKRPNLQISKVESWVDGLYSVDSHMKQLELVDGWSNKK